MKVLPETCHVISTLLFLMHLTNTCTVIVSHDSQVLKDGLCFWSAA